MFGPETLTIDIQKSEGEAYGRLLSRIAPWSRVALVEVGPHKYHGLETIATWFNSSTTGTATFAHGGEMQPAGFIRNTFNEKLSEWSGRQKVFPTSPVRTACSHIASPIVPKKAAPMP